MVMFGKAIAKVGADPVRPRLYQRLIINSLPFAFRGSVLWVAALIGEEIFDSLQRQMMDDRRTAADGAAAHADPRHRGGPAHPVRPRRPAQACPVHVAVQAILGRQPERRSAARSSGSCSPTRCSTPGSGWMPGRRAGWRGAPRTASQVQIAGFAPLAAFLEEVGLMGPIARRMWRRSGFLPSGAPHAAGRLEAEADDDEEVYDGPATVDGRISRVRLTGHLDPIDGRYHWQGTVFDMLPDDARGPLAVTVDKQTACRPVHRAHPAGWLLDHRRRRPTLRPVAQPPASRPRTRRPATPEIEQRQRAVGTPGQPGPDPGEQDRETTGAAVDTPGRWPAGRARPARRSRPCRPRRCRR